MQQASSLLLVPFSFLGLGRFPSLGVRLPIINLVCVSYLKTHVLEFLLSFLIEFSSSAPRLNGFCRERPVARSADQGSDVAFIVARVIYSVSIHYLWEGYANMFASSWLLGIVLKDVKLHPL